MNGHQEAAARRRQQALAARPWITAAAQLWASGETVAAIAQRLGVVKNIISGVAHRNRDLFPRRPSPIIRKKRRAA